jgi:hypothetical protein
MERLLVVIQKSRLIVRMCLVEKSFRKKGLGVNPIVWCILNVLKIDGNDALQSHYYRNNSELGFEGAAFSKKKKRKKNRTIE